MHEDLLAQALMLATADTRGRPKQANLRRSVSASYYALFHYLADLACRELLGGQNDVRGYRHVLSRTFVHGTMKKACISFAGGTLPAAVRSGLGSFAVPPDLADVAAVFVEAQEDRHSADYDRSGFVRRTDAIALIGDVRRSIRKLDQLPDSNLRRFFLACLLTWDTLLRR